MLMMDLVLNLTEVLDKNKVNTSQIPCLSLSDNEYPSAMIQIYSEFLRTEDSLYAPLIHRFMMKLHDRRVRMEPFVSLEEFKNIQNAPSPNLIKKKEIP